MMGNVIVSTSWAPDGGQVINNPQCEKALKRSGLKIRGCGSQIPFSVRRSYGLGRVRKAQCFSFPITFLVVSKSHHLLIILLQITIICSWGHLCLQQLFGGHITSQWPCARLCPALHCDQILAAWNQPRWLFAPWKLTNVANQDLILFCWLSGWKQWWRKCE